MTTTIVCNYCGNVVEAWRIGVVTVQTRQHYLNNGSACPGSNEQRSQARY
jgi:hypothetical protein